MQPFLQEHFPVPGAVVLLSKMDQQPPPGGGTIAVPATKRAVLQGQMNSARSLLLPALPLGCSVMRVVGSKFLTDKRF